MPAADTKRISWSAVPLLSESTPSNQTVNTLQDGAIWQADKARATGRSSSWSNCSSRQAEWCAHRLQPGHCAVSTIVCTFNALISPYNNSSSTPHTCHCTAQTSSALPSRAPHQPLHTARNRPATTSSSSTTPPAAVNTCSAHAASLRQEPRNGPQQQGRHRSTTSQRHSGRRWRTCRSGEGAAQQPPQQLGGVPASQPDAPCCAVLCCGLGL